MRTVHEAARCRQSTVNAALHRDGCPLPRIKFAIFLSFVNSIVERTRKEPGSNAHLLQGRRVASGKAKSSGRGGKPEIAIEIKRQPARQIPAGPQCQKVMGAWSLSVVRTLS
jgi:hypothetical protein